MASSISRKKETTAEKKARFLANKSTASSSRTNRLVKRQLHSGVNPAKQDNTSTSFGALATLPTRQKGTAGSLTTQDRVRNQIRFGTADSNRRKNPLSITDFNKKVNDFQSQTVDQRRANSFDPNESFGKVTTTGVDRPTLNAQPDVPGGNLRNDGGFFSTEQVTRAKQEAKNTTDTAIRGVTTNFDTKINAIRQKAFDNKRNKLLEEGKKLNLDKQISQLEEANRLTEKQGLGNVSESTARVYKLNKQNIARMKEGLPPLKIIGTGAFHNVEVLAEDPLNQKNFIGTAEEKNLQTQKQEAINQAESTRVQTERNRINDVISSLSGTAESKIVSEAQDKKDSLETKRNKLLEDSINQQREANQQAVALQRKQLKETLDKEIADNKELYDDRVEEKLALMASSGRLPTDAIGTNKDGSPRYTRSAISVIEGIKKNARKDLDRLNKSSKDTYNNALNDLSLKEISFNNDLALKEIEIKDTQLAKQQEQAIADAKAGRLRQEDIQDKAFTAKLNEAKRVQGLEDFKTKELFKADVEQSLKNVGLSGKDIISSLKTLDGIKDPELLRTSLEAFSSELDKAGINYNLADYANSVGHAKLVQSLNDKILANKLVQKPKSTSPEKFSTSDKILGSKHTFKELQELKDGQKISASEKSKAMDYREKVLGIDPFKEAQASEAQPTNNDGGGVIDYFKGLLSPDTKITQETINASNTPEDIAAQKATDELVNKALAK